MVDFSVQEKLVSKELIWLFNNSDSEIGIKSSWDSLTSGNSHNHKAFHDPYHDGILQAISKKRILDNILKEQSIITQNILFANFGPLITPPLAIKFCFSKEYKINLVPTILALSIENGTLSREYTETLLPTCMKKVNRKETVDDSTYLIEKKRLAVAAYMNAITSVFPAIKKAIKWS
jgi:hypothetical protein